MNEMETILQSESASEKLGLKNLATNRISPPLPFLAPRASNSHKGTYGHALLVGGSRGMSGSIAIAGMAALRGGAGLVRVAVPDRCLETVAGFHPCLMTIPLPDDSCGQISMESLPLLLQLSSVSTCIGLGPGLGQSDAIVEVVSQVFGQVDKPMVVDADALNALAKVKDWRGKDDCPRILTPHPLEFQRLSGVETSNRSAQIESAVVLARERQVIVVLKGYRTIVTDGTRTYENDTGNPGMATGGSGDCLTGMIVALVCQGMSPFDAAVMGTYLHGMAGDLAQSKLGGVCVIASDIIDQIPGAFSRMRSQS